MATWKSGLLSQLGSFLEAFKSILQEVVDPSGNEDLMGRLNAEPELVSDIAHLVLGRSLALPVVADRVTRAADLTNFTLLRCGCHIVAVSKGVSGAGKVKKDWIRLGDTFTIAHQDAPKIVHRIEWRKDTAEIHLYGVDAVTRREAEMIECTIDGIALPPNHPARCLETTLT
jgi:hypothetical protein